MWVWLRILHLARDGLDIAWAIGGAISVYANANTRQSQWMLPVCALTAIWLCVCVRVRALVHYTRSMQQQLQKVCVLNKQ